MEFKLAPNLTRRVFAAIGSNSSGTDSGTAHAMAGTTAATTGQYGTVFDPARGGWDVEQAVTRGLERVIWVFRCVDAIASNQSKLNIVLRKGDRFNGRIVNDPEFFKLLNRKPNDYETAAQFRYRLSGQALLSKRGVFIEVATDSYDVPVALHLLPPGQVEPVPHPEKFVSKFRLNMFAGGIVELDAKKVIWIRLKPHPTDPFSQMTPLMAAGLAADTDWLSRLFNRNFLANDGRPGLLVAIKGRLNHSDAEEIKSRFSGGPERAGRTTVVEADAISVSDLAANPRDVQWLEGIRGSKEDILLAFGTPESVLGNASGRTFDNADAEKEVWWEETMMPHCDGLAMGFDPLTRSTNDDEFPSFDYDRVDVLQRKKRALHDRALAQFQAGVITIDDYYEATGRERWDVPGTRVLYLSNGAVVGKNEQDEKAVANLTILGPGGAIVGPQSAQQGAGQPALPPSGQPLPLNGQHTRQLTDIARRGALQGVQEGQRSFENMLSARAAQLASAKIRPRAKVEQKNDAPLVGEVIAPHPYADLRTVYEGQFEVAMDLWCALQQQIVPERLGHAKVRKGTRHWTGEEAGTKALNPNYVVDIDRWTTNLRNNMDSLMERAAQATMKQTAKSMQDEGVLNVMEHRGLGGSQERSALLRVYGTTSQQQKAVSDLLKPLQAIVEEAATNQSMRIQEKIREMDSEGRSLNDIQAEVRRMTSDKSPWRQGLARYLTTAIVEGAQHATWRQAGDLASKHWNTVEDEVVRHSHQAVDRNERPVIRKFKVGRSWMEYPGDPTGAIQERANCRCYLTYSINDKYAEEFDMNAG